ncbi:MAG: alpha-N-arabinofuranosidase [Ignavibacteriae bacterium]|nr:MAG: alpha-N-arabinofuranosidase [Ignavibacteriota bacterium]
MKMVTAVLFSFAALISTALSQTTTVVVDASNLRLKINKNLYGQFSEHLGNCIYGGIWVGEQSTIPNTNGIRNDVVEALKRIKVPVLRWPGGCFADEYHWKDGIGPREKRPTMINTNWGGVTEDNSFGTHEFLDLCSQIGCEPYFSGNVGSGTVQELSQWVEYVNSDNVSPMTTLRKQNGHEKSWGVKYWGIGNESWGCGGNMRPEFCADQTRRYGTYMRDYGHNRLFKIACGASSGDYQWTETMMKNALGFMSGLSLHHYAFQNGRTAADFDESGWFSMMKNTLLIEEFITKHSAIMDIYDPNKKVAMMVDEWGTWYKVEPGTNPGFLFQQNTMRDAITAACNLNIFNNHCDRVRMANIAQMVNVLQAMILTKDDKMLLTPTYHVFDLFKVHQNALWVKTSFQSPEYTYQNEKLPAINCSASIDGTGKLHISLCNIDPKSSQKITCELKKYSPRGVTGQILTANAMNAYNSFDKPAEVVPQKFSDYTFSKNGLSVSLPPMSVVVLELDGSVELPSPLELKNPMPGITCMYFEGIWKNLPGFNGLTPVRTETMGQIAIPEKNSSENFAACYVGYIKIPADGSYTFYVNSDDGADIVIDDNVVVDNDGQHAPVELSGTEVLKTGYHKIKVGFFQAGGGKVLDVALEGPGLPKQIIPKGMLFHE